MVRQDQRRVAGKRAQHVCRGAVVQMVEAAAQRLAIERDGAPAVRGAGSIQVASMAAKGRLQGVGIERHEQVAQGVHRWRTSEPGTEEGVEALAVDGHEGDDALVRGRPGQHSQDREQQQVAHRVARQSKLRFRDNQA